MMNLKEIKDSGLYQPDDKATFVFLLWAAEPGRPKEIPLDETWGEDGPAKYVGFHVFLNAPLSGADAEALAAGLRGTLPPDPVTTGFAWTTCPPKAFSVLGAISMTIADGRAVVAADSPIEVPKPVPALTVPRGLAAEGWPELTGWTLLERQGQPALTLALLGKACGGIGFQALLASRVRGDETVKPLAQVQLDPLRPDPAHTSITPLGPEYLLTEGPPGTYKLALASP
jgi:hypothetical protein